MKEFKYNDTIEDMLPCVNRSIILKAKQINEDFKISYKEGSSLGKSGDYLMRNGIGELYVIDKNTFERIYYQIDVTKEKDNLINNAKETVKAIKDIWFK